MFNAKPKTNLSSIRSFKCAKNECGFEQFTTVQNNNSEPSDAYIVKKQYAQVSSCNYLKI